MLINWRTLFLLLLSLWALQAKGNMRSVTMIFPQDLSAPRWFYDQLQAKDIKGLPFELYLIKKDYQESRYDSCLKKATHMQAKAKSLKPWLLVVRSQCAIKLKANKVKLDTLLRIFSELQTHEQLFYRGPQAAILRGLYIEMRLQALELQNRFSRKNGWESIDELNSRADWLGLEQKAKFYKLAGELAFVEQNLLVAQNYFTKSIGIKDSDELRNKISSLEQALGGKTKPLVGPIKASTATEEDDLGVSEDELKVLNRFRTAVKVGDLASAVEDGVELMGQFPGGTRAKWIADRILEIYLEVAGKDDVVYKPLRKKIVDNMNKADGARLYRWANNAYVKGYYADAVRLAEESFDKLKGLPDSTKSLLLAANANLYSGDYKRAEKLFERLTLEHFGSPEATEAFYRLGLLSFRRQEYSSAAAFFERLLALPQNEDFEYRGLYWHWRSSQKMFSDKGKASVERLIQKYPITYYGLKAKAEQNKNEISWPKEENFKLKGELWLSESENQAWERLLILLKAGWFDEAQAEIADLPEPQSAEDKVFRAQLSAAAFDYVKVFELITNAWDQNPSLVNLPILKLNFPNEFQPLIQTEAKKQGVNPFLVQALIRQESSFRLRAQSPSNAYGLMQLVSPTANEIAKILKTKGDLKIPEDLFNPNTNIKLGTFYLARLIRTFKGNIPLALAAYNTGIGRMRKWIASRPDLGAIENSSVLSLETDLWIDELPWDETSYYVKAVLRNYLIYRMLESGRVVLQDSFWQVGS